MTVLEVAQNYTLPMRIKFNMTEILEFQHLLKIIRSWNLKETWIMKWESHMEWDGTWNSLIADSLIADCK